MFHNIQKQKEIFTEILALLLLFMLLTVISFYHVEQSMLVSKFHFQWGIKSLLENYSLYHQSLQKFLLRTSAFHTASSMEGWNTVFYLWPLFAFCDLLGGLSIKSMYFFTITTSLMFVSLFYWWIRWIWGKHTALYAAFFLGFSSIFQDFARSGTYHAYSLLIGIVWVVFFFYCSDSKKITNYFLLGLLTGLTWYGYGILRYLTLVVIIHALFLKGSRKASALGVILAGMMIVLVPGFLIMTKALHIDMTQYHKPLFLLIFDKAASFKEGHTAKIVFSNLGTLGAKIINAVKANHRYLWNSFLAIPLFIGIWSSIRQARRKSPDRLLLLLAAAIYLPPWLLLNGVNEKRLLLFIIPSYCFIGLGMKEIVTLISSLQNILLKCTMAILLVSFIFIIIFHEMTFFQNFILSPKKKVDVGFLTYVHKIKKMGICGNMYYLDGKIIFKGTKESHVMRVALLENGKSCLNVINQMPQLRISDISKDFYLSRGLRISDQEFDAWCRRNSLNASLVLKSSIPDGRHSQKDASFKLYTVQKENQNSE